MSSSSKTKTVSKVVQRKRQHESNSTTPSCNALASAEISAQHRYSTRSTRKLFVVDVDNADDKPTTKIARKDSTQTEITIEKDELKKSLKELAETMPFDRKSQPILNNDVLKDIFVQALQDATPQNWLETLERFMLSGKESFEIVLSYFREINEDVEITIRGICITLPSEETPRCIGYKFPLLLKAILPLILLQMNTLTIKSWPNVEVTKRYDFEKIIGGNYKTFIMACEQNIPKKFEEALMKNESLETIIDKRQKSLTFLPIPPSCRELIVQHFHFFNEIPSQSRNFSKIEKLVINGGCRDFSSILGPKKLINFIANNFTNLKFLNIRFYDAGGSNTRFHTVLEMKKEDFLNIPIMVKGTIKLDGGTEKKKFHLDFINQARNQRDIKFVTTPGLNDKFIITTSFEIHDGLNFEFTSSFCNNRYRVW